jgi:hypothetical protein
MGSGQGAVVEYLPVGGFAAFVWSRVPGGVARFGAKGAMSVDVVEILGADTPGRYGGDGDAASGPLLGWIAVGLIELGEFLGRGGGRILAGFFVMGAAGEEQANERNRRATAKAT